MSNPKIEIRVKDYGTMTAELYPDMAPKTVENFLKLAKEGKDCILITGPLFLTELLDRFRVQNYVIQRSGIFKVQPLEKFVISEKEAHCGGCGHNCFLSNPGCGVGREKAQRRKQHA